MARIVIIMLMEVAWTFNVGWMMIGLLIFAAGGAIVALHQKIADSMMAGVVDYQKVKLVGLIVIGLGLIIMINLHTLILSWLVSLIFPGR